MAAALGLVPARNDQTLAETPFEKQDRIPRLPRVETLIHGSDERNPNNILFTVGPNEEEFVVNKCLVMISSLHLEGLIKRANQSKETLKFPKVHPADFKLMLEYVLGESTWIYDNLQDTCRLIETAAEFELYDFITTICQYLLGKIQDGGNIFDDQSVCRAWVAFQSFDAQSGVLAEKAFKYIMENASSIFNGNHVLSLGTEDLIEILRQDNLVVVSEIEVLNALLGWGLNVLKEDCKTSSHENLRAALASPIYFVRFPNMTEAEFQDYVKMLNVLTDQQVVIMEKWYKDKQPNVTFNSQTREYSAKSATAGKIMMSDEKNWMEKLHKLEMKNLLSQFQRRLENHDLCIKNQSLQKAIQKSNLMLKPTLQDLLQAKLESLPAASSKSKCNTPNNDIDIKFLKMVADKIRNNSPLQSVRHKFDILATAVGVDFQCLRTGKQLDFNEEIMAEFEKFFWSREVYETLSWKIFQNESAFNLMELQEFGDTEAFACAFIFRNNTNDTISNFQSYYPNGKLYIAPPNDIRSDCTHQFGHTHENPATYGVFSYDVGSARIFVLHYLHGSFNDFGIAIAPTSLSPNIAWNALHSENWTMDSTRIKAMKGRQNYATTDVEKCITLNNVCLHAELIGNHPKAVLRVLLTSV